MKRTTRTHAARGACRGGCCKRRSAAAGRRRSAIEAHRSRRPRVGSQRLRGDPSRGLLDGAHGHPDLPAGLSGRGVDQGGDLRGRGQWHGDRAQRTGPDPHQRPRDRRARAHHGQPRRLLERNSHGDAGRRRSQPRSGADPRRSLRTRPEAAEAGQLEAPCRSATRCTRSAIRTASTRRSPEASSRRSAAK